MISSASLPGSQSRIDNTTFQHPVSHNLDAARGQELGAHGHTRGKVVLRAT
jgi:hypothetical protein